ncbi:RagB/SusD family nutrient uptake outer membrane protein [Fibrivirga algicola]|uniref:RagB/SusD family nutrient uptake outer membrane protein n=1 Tax=Fibrivirga algicola TaxID=2950420 RepID=A0ABX0QGS5_9BACT|nr:RagB/SusD family nutrient uptake outer membrane protein [Fibrivirga algicola]NID10048.1 RagB/SusD family nutrient uptake outer membrane protein [Fibrivirga algicola]
MVKKLIYSVSALLLLLLPTSCNTYLDLRPQDGITKDEFWRTKEQVQAAVTGCYAGMLNGLPETLFLWGELRADMITSTFLTRPDETDMINVNLLPSNGIANWRSVYQIINYCNTVIQFAPTVLESDKTYTQEALNVNLAEAKALRALLYFYLARTFGDVPLKLDATFSDNQITPIPKSTKDEILAQVVKDLTEAEPNAPLTYGDVASNKGRVTRYMVNALQADVALWMEKYDEALAACNKITSSAKFGLIQGNAFHNQVFVQGNSNEGIFELQYDRQRINGFYGMFVAPRRFQASSYVIDDVYTQDFQDDTKKDLRGDESAVRATDGTIWKYVSLNGTTLRVINESYAHWIVYRYADVLLMKAEALAMLKRGPEALAIVQQIRDRAQALVGTLKTPDPADTESVMDYILEERARELAFEGKRWYDVLRHTKRNNYKRLDILLDMVARSVPPDRQQSAIAKYKDYNSHYLPIFQYELQTNKLLVQNPFYK